MFFPYGKNNHMFIIRGLLKLTILALVLFTVGYLSLTDSNFIESINPGISDKTIHFIGYAILVIFLYWIIPFKSLILILIISNLIGFGLEFWQQYTPNREMDLMEDGLYNTAGTLFSLSILRILGFKL